jgi:hypothetical protein
MPHFYRGYDFSKKRILVRVAAESWERIVAYEFGGVREPNNPFLPILNGFPEGTEAKRSGYM